MDVSNDIAGLYNLESKTDEKEFSLFAVKVGSNKWIGAMVVIGAYKEPFDFCLDNIVRKVISTHYQENNLPNYEKRFIDNFDNVKKLFLLKQVKTIE